MNKPETTTALTLAERAKQIDAISSAAMTAFASAESFEKELVVAQAMNDLRAALTPEVMAPVMALMNTDLGFRTDRDPKLTPTDKEGKPTQPYSMEIIRECFIESRLRGFHSVGNEWNIIAGKFYGCLNGFERKVRSHPRVTDFKDYFEVPRAVGDKGAIVKCRAEWRQDGVPQSLEREFAVRVNYGMGADAITGKAKRKLYAAVYARLSGKVTPEGEVGDEAVIDVKATATPADQLFKAKAEEAKPAEAEANPPVTTPAQSPAAATSTPQEQLAHVVTQAGFDFAAFFKCMKTTGWMKPDELDGLTGFTDLSTDTAKRFLNAQRGLLRELRKK